MPSKDLLDQTIALSGVMQSVILVNKLALTGEFDAKNAKVLIDSLFVGNPETALSVYGKIDNLSLGLVALTNNFGRGESVQTLSYFNALLIVTKRLLREPSLMSILDSGIEQIKERLIHFSSDHINIHSALGDLYTQTVSKIPPRVLVKGRAELSNNPEDAARIRSLLLSGVRAVVLWYQCNGSRLGLILSSRKIAETAFKLTH